MQFASAHAYLGVDEEEVDETLLDAVEQEGLSNIAQQQQYGGLPQINEQSERQRSRSRSRGSIASDDEEGEAPPPRQQNLARAGLIDGDGKPKPEKKKKGFFSRLFGGSSSSSQQQQQPGSSSSQAPPQQQQQQQQQPGGGRFQAFIQSRAQQPQQSQQSFQPQQQQQQQQQPGAAGAGAAYPPPPPHPGNYAPPPPQAHKPGAYKRAVDTNVLALKFNTLSQAAEELFAGDAILCEGCSAALNNLSLIRDHAGKLVKGKAQQNASSSSSVPAPQAAGVPADAGALPAHIQLQAGQLFWACEFCSHENILDGVQPAEIPTTGSRDYVVEAAPEAQMAANEVDDSYVLFLIDISGSMCVSAPVSGKLKLRGTKKIDPSLLAFGDIDRTGMDNSSVTYVSRLQSVQASISSQLEALAKSHPNKRVGLITFNGEVTLIGDAMSPRDTVTITGDKLNDLETLQKIGSEFKIETKISKSVEKLTDALFSLEETGPTALGPALVTSIALASKKRGSTILICTDGLANVGLGDMSRKDRSAEELQEWYTTQGSIAKLAGVTVNVVSIKGDECKLEALGLVAAETGGKVERVDPSNIASEFSNMLANPVIATNVSVTFFLHAGMKFRNEDDVVEAEAQKAPVVPPVPAAAGGAPGGVDAASMMSDDNVPIAPPIAKAKPANKLTRDIGNVWSDSETSLEYGLRTQDILAQYAHMKSLPFQAQILFTTLNGMKAMRVITAAQSVTLDRAVAESNVRLEMLSAQIANKSADLARKGKFKESRLNWISAAPMMSRAARSPQQQQVYNNYAQHIDQFDRSMAQQQRLEETAEMSEAMNAPPAPAGASSAASSSSNMKKPMRKSNLSDETYRVMHKTKQLNSAGLL